MLYITSGTSLASILAIGEVDTGTSNHLGQFESGITAAWWGAVPAVVVGGVGTLIVVGLWLRWFPDLIRREVIAVKRE